MKENYISREIELFEETTVEDSALTDNDKMLVYNKIKELTFELKWYYKVLRQLCNEADILPFLGTESDYTDLLALSEVIQSEVNKYSIYVDKSTIYDSLSKEGIEEIEKNKTLRIEYEDWINEGLFDNMKRKGIV
jgi:hypothetical protein